jgi:hypothetical protein
MRPATPGNWKRAGVRTRLSRLTPGRRLGCCCWAQLPASACWLTWVCIARRQSGTRRRAPVFRRSLWVEHRRRSSCSHQRSRCRHTGELETRGGSDSVIPATPGSWKRARVRTGLSRLTPAASFNCRSRIKRSPTAPSPPPRRDSHLLDNNRGFLKLSHLPILLDQQGLVAPCRLRANTGCSANSVCRASARCVPCVRHAPA